MKLIITFLSLLILFAACNNPECTTTNPVFNNNEPKSEVYKAELARQLEANQSALNYYLAEYHETNTFPYMIVTIQGNDICAKALVTIEKHDNDIAAIIKAKGKGYIGAELAGLKIAVVQQPGQTQFLYQDMNYILD